MIANNPNELLRSLHDCRMRRRGCTPDAGLRIAPASTMAPCDARAPPLLVLDLDGTLLDTSRRGMRPGQPSFTLTDNCMRLHETRLRPGLASFLAAIRPHFDLAVFTAASRDYAERMVAGIDSEVPGFRASLVVIFSQEHTTIDHEEGRMQIIKDLRSLARHCGRQMSRCLIVDDTPQTYRHNLSNALPVPTYAGGLADDALERLQHYLLTMLARGDPLDVSGYALAPLGARPLIPDEVDGRCCDSQAPASPELP